MDKVLIEWLVTHVAAFVLGFLFGVLATWWSRG